MKKLFTFFLSALMCTMVMAQNPTATIAKAGDTKPVIDGVVDDVWADIEKHNIDKPYGTEVPTIGGEGETYWQALWAEEGMYVLVVVNDDEWDPWYAPNGNANDWTFDKVELYFDVNPVLTDGGGGSGKAGNWQVTRKPLEALIDGTPETETIEGGDVVWSYKVFDGTKYNVETFVPWESIPDLNGNNFSSEILGFDVTVIDRDVSFTAHQRAVWANTATESWNNMDGVGYLTLEGSTTILIEDIALTADVTTISTDNGTAQITPAVLPADYTQGYKYVITEGASLASISSTGLVTAKRDGTVKIKAYSVDDFVSSNEVTITITGQIITAEEVSVLKNGNFEFGVNGENAYTGVTGFQSWGTNAGTAAPFAVVDGWAAMNMVLSTNRWDIALSQGFPVIDATTVYKLKFKAKASADMSIDFIIEDTANGWPKDAQGANASHPELIGGSDWQLPLTTTEQWYTIDVTFPELKANSKYSIGWQGGLHEGTFYIDNVSMMTEADAGLITSVSPKLANRGTLSVYPTVVERNSKVNVKLAAAKGTVTVYNALGQKMVEKVATSDRVIFDTNFRQGMYIVKSSDGSTGRFIVR
jgi:hypothetical protein